MKISKFIILLAYLLFGTIPLNATNSIADSKLIGSIYSPPPITVVEGEFIQGMVGLFEALEAAGFSIDTSSIDTSTTYQELLLLLHSENVDTSLVDSIGFILGSSAINLSNNITEERFAGLVFIAIEMYFEGFSTYTNYMSVKGYSDSDIETMGNDILTYDTTAGWGAPPCNDIFIASVVGIVTMYLECIAGASIPGAILCGVGSGVAIYVAALVQCECLCSRYGSAPSGCATCY